MIGAAAVQRTSVFVGAAGTMSSLQSLRELISERLAAAAEEICRLCEGTIVQYEQELCRQRRLLDICWKPQLQLHHIVLTEEDLCNQQRNFRVDQENPEPPQTPEELQDPEPSLIKEEPEELCISQDEEQLDLKQEIETWMEIPTLEEHVDSEADGNNQQISVLPQHCVIKDEDLWNQQRNLREKQNDPEPTQTKEEQEEPELLQSEEELEEEPGSLMTKEEEEEFISQAKEELNLKQETETWMEIPTLEEHVDSEADGNNQQILNGTDSLDEEENQHEESTSTPDEETEPQNRDQRKRRDRSHVQSVARSHISESQWDSDVRKKFKMKTFVKKQKQSRKEKRLSSAESGKRSRITHNVSVHMRTTFDERPYGCEECDKGFTKIAHLKAHMRTHTGDKPFSCKECDKSFNLLSNLKRHMRIHTGEKPFLCKECDKSFGRKCHLTEHIRIHTGEKPFLCKHCDSSFSQKSSLKRHMRFHTAERPF